MTCGHPKSAIVSSDEGTSYCSECEKEGMLKQWIESQTQIFFDVGGHGLEARAKRLLREAYERGRRDTMNKIFGNHGEQK